MEHWIIVGLGVTGGVALILACLWACLALLDRVLVLRQGLGWLGRVRRLVKAVRGHLDRPQGAMETAELRRAYAEYTRYVSADGVSSER